MEKETRKHVPDTYHSGRFGRQELAEDYEFSRKKQGRDQMDMELWYEPLFTPILSPASYYLVQRHWLQINYIQIQLYHIISMRNNSLGKLTEICTWHMVYTQ